MIINSSYDFSIYPLIPRLNNKQTVEERWLVVWSGDKPGEKSKDGVKKRQASLAERETETEKIVTLVHHESWWWSSTHQAQLGLLVEMQQIKTTHIFQNPWVHEDQKEKENRFETRKIFIKKDSSSWDLRAEIVECYHDKRNVSTLTIVIRSLRPELKFPVKLESAFFLKY